MVPAKTTATADALAAWLGDEEQAAQVVHVQTIAARRPIFDELDPPPSPAVAAALARRGVERLYRHQVQGIRRVRAGVDTVVVAGTASGKSLVYQVPIAEQVAGDEPATALAIYPTKALTRDQLRSFADFPAVEAAVYDGDTPREQRPAIRRSANVVLTNPDMLHIGVLPHHARWAPFLSRLALVVVDELHTLRGIFGSHVAHVLRRLQRIAAHYGSRPTFVFTSATIGNPGELATRLIGRDVEVVDQDTSPAGERSWVLWNPPLEDEETGIRRSSLGESTDLFVDLVRRGVPTIAFCRSRRATELMYRWARDRLDDDLAGRISPYRGGYLAEDRRRIEQALFSGELLGVTATDALELGIDIGGLDAAIVNTFPGTIASLRQQAGRAGRTREHSLAVLVAGQDALDQYYMSHPDQLFTRPAEAAVVNPDNPRLVLAHAACAAYELPLLPDDRTVLGDGIEEAATELAGRGDLKLRDGRLFWARGRAPAPSIDIRTSGGGIYTIADDRGDLLGWLEEHRAFSQAHPGAVYLHQGDTYLVEDLDRERREVRVRRARVDYYTQPREDKDLQVLRVEAEGTVGRLGAARGVVRVETHVVAYRRKAIRSGEILDTVPLDLPPLHLTTEAFWYTIPDHLYRRAGVAARDVPGTLHAAEHTAIAMLPMFAICDRWDVGGLSTALHPDAGGGVFFIYDGYEGGAGISAIGYAAGERHLRATLAAIADCPCETGCPSCVQSPKCGNFNEPLDKRGARLLLEKALG